MKFKIPDPAIDKAVTDLIQFEIQKLLSAILWNIDDCVFTPIMTTVRNSVVSDSMIIMTTANLKHVPKIKPIKVLTCSSGISGQVIAAARDKDEIIRIIEIESKAIAHKLVDGVMEHFDTDYDSEIGRVIESKMSPNANRDMFPLSTPEPEAVTPDIKKTIESIRLIETLEERKKNAKWKLE